MHIYHKPITPGPKFYLIYDRIVGVRIDRKDYLFQDGQWVKDTKHVIGDHLVGFDPSEPFDSTYRFGSTSVLMEMDEISEEEARELIGEHVLDLPKEQTGRSAAHNLDIK